MLRPTIVRGAILDVDGTLVNSNDAHAHAWVRAFTEGGHEIRYDQIRPLMGMGGDKIIPELTGLNPHGAAGKLIASRRREIFARAELAKVRRERQRHALVAREEFLKVERREFQRFGEHDVFVLDAVGAVQQVRGVQLEEPARESGGLRPVGRQGHHVHAEQYDRRRVVHGQ
jgi:beta-phosphoglucomutase-like phosphatase (HAD superfamily)